MNQQHQFLQLMGIKAWVERSPHVIVGQNYPMIRLICTPEICIVAEFSQSAPEAAAEGLLCKNILKAISFLNLTTEQFCMIERDTLKSKLSELKPAVLWFWGKNTGEQFLMDPLIKTKHIKISFSLSNLISDPTRKKQFWNDLLSLEKIFHEAPH